MELAPVEEQSPEKQAPPPQAGTSSGLQLQAEELGRMLHLALLRRVLEPVLDPVLDPGPA
jgi:hypothetical protein